MEVTGVLHVKYDTNAVSDKFTKRDFILMISENPSYPQYVSFQLAQDKCSLLDMFSCGDNVTVSFNLRGRSWTSPQGEVKYFNTLEAWRIVVATGVATHAVNAPSPIAQSVVQNNAPTVSIENLDDSGNDLPF
jgi:Domain of unknown function (DUF3127)